VGDIFAQVRLEDDVHRTADAHLSFERQLLQFGHPGIAAVRAEQVFRPDGDFLAGQAVETGGGHAVRILHMAQIFCRHPGLGAARTGGLEQERLHEGLRQVDHHRRRRQLMLGPGERMIAPALHPADLFACKALAEHVLAHQILVRAEHIGLGLDLLAQIPQHFHGALVGNVRARRVGQPAVAVHRHVLYAVGRQQRRRGRSGRAGANDQDVGLNVSHDLFLLR
jgi:hypothetical protein